MNIDQTIEEAVHQYIDIYDIDEFSYSVVDGISHILRAHHQLHVPTKELSGIVEKIIYSR